MALHTVARSRSLSRVRPACSPSSSVRSSAVVEQPVDERVQRSSNATCDSISSTHLDARREPGLDRVLARADVARTRAASTPRSRRARRARRGPLSFVRHVRRRRAAAACSSSRRMRSRSSAAAFSVNVTAAISRIGTPDRVVERHDTVDERLGLARTRAGLHEQRRVTVVRRSRRARLRRRRARRRRRGRARSGSCRLRPASASCSASGSASATYAASSGRALALPSR